MTLPRLLPKKPKRDGRLRSPSHLRWVRQHECCTYKQNCYGPVETAHVRNGTDGGASLKPGDQWAISLCHAHHAEQHQIGEPRFERKYGIDMKKLAMEFAARSPALRRKRSP